MFSDLRDSLRRYVERSAFAKAIRALPNMMDEIQTLVEVVGDGRREYTHDLSETATAEVPEGLYGMSYDIVVLTTDEDDTNDYVVFCPVSSPPAISGHRVKIVWVSGNTEHPPVFSCNEGPFVYDSTKQYVYPDIRFELGSFIVLEWSEVYNDWRLLEHNMESSRYPQPRFDGTTVYSTEFEAEGSFAIGMSTSQSNIIHAYATVDDGEYSVILGSGPLSGTQNYIIAESVAEGATITILGTIKANGATIVPPIISSTGEFIRVEWKEGDGSWDLVDFSNSIVIEPQGC